MGESLDSHDDSRRFTLDSVIEDEGDNLSLGQVRVIYS